MRHGQDGSESIDEVKNHNRMIPHSTEYACRRVLDQEDTKKKSPELP